VTSRLHLACLAVAAALAVAPPCAAGAADPVEAAVAQARATDDWETTAPLRLEIPGVTRAWQLNDLILAGDATPDAAALEDLRNLGVRTVISIDQAPPDVFLVAGKGLESIHSPIRFGQPDPGELMTVLSAMAATTGPYYFHGGGNDSRGLWVGAMATAWNERRAGTRAVRLLHAMDFPADLSAYWLAAVDDAFDLGQDRVRAIPADFHARRQPAPARVWMHQALRSFVVLREAEEAGWVSAPSHGRTTPDFEAEALADTLERWVALQGSEHPGWVPGIEAAAARARALAGALRERDPAAVADAWSGLRSACMECHNAHREPREVRP
jgi:hypothetical protein